MSSLMETAADTAPTERKIGIKFLLSNALAGALIGKGGQAIKELAAVSEARVTISGLSEVYPGSNDRVALITGTKDAVSIAQTLMWEMIAQNSEQTTTKKEWSPESVVNTLGQNDSIEVSCKVTFPAAAGGIILGKGGETLQSITSQSGAKVLMSSKADALFTQERVATVIGRTGDCVKCVDLIIAKMAEAKDLPMFVNRGTTYNSPIRNTFYGYGRGDKRQGHGQSEVDNLAETNITISIPNELIGNIFGRNGSTMREIISLSGAKVVVSGRNEFVDNTTNRLVTITGSPANAQAAHLFITQRLETPSNPPPRKPRGSRSNEV